jgi:hypothetical protein
MRLLLNVKSLGVKGVAVEDHVLLFLFTLWTTTSAAYSMACDLTHVTQGIRKSTCMTTRL